MISLIKKFDDKMLVRQAEQALIADPGIDHSTIQVKSKSGIVTLSGSTRNNQEHRRALEVVRRSLEKRNLKFERIVDEISNRQKEF